MAVTCLTSPRPLATGTNREEVLIVVPPHILDELLRRERERTRPRVDDDRPRLELPLPPPPPARRRADEDEDADRGVLVIDLF
jgi:hypothetical protein